jgi:phenylalanine-4-hydroxylase
VDSFDHLFALVTELEQWMLAGKLDNVAPGEPEVSETDLASFLHGDRAPPPVTTP